MLERVDYCGRIPAPRTEGRGEGRGLRALLEKRFGIADVKFKRQPGAGPMSKSTFLLKEAFERGYFDVPKKVSIEELSDELGVPPTP